MVKRVVAASPERAVIQYLADKMPGVDIRGYRQGAPDGQQIQVRKTGGWTADVIVDTAQITITVWGRTHDDEDDTEQLAMDAISWMRVADISGWLGEIVCRNITVVSTPYPDPDPVTDRVRYSATLAIDLRGTVVE